MASTAGRIVVRQHKQLIKFPNRIKMHRNPSSNNKGPEVSSVIASITQQVPSFKPLNAPSVKATPAMTSSYDDGIITLPFRFQRKLISQEEMEYIERGGPE
ncbi:28S ribosomal protein S36, mitochondrial [Exaiptasia diaphana]|nr:28S ribosomal protein S36, mitochondrial [Exaiptasia diaphana]